MILTLYAVVDILPDLFKAKIILTMATSSTPKRLLSLSQRHVQCHHQAESDSEEHNADIGMLP